MEYRKRCKVCGKIWCYTDQDLQKDLTNSVNTALHAVGGIASAVGGNIFQQQYFADRMENDERKNINRNQCPNCNSLECEEITEDELENYKTKESFSKAQVAINNNATTETLLKRVELLLEDKEWANANAYCDNVLDVEPENGTAYLYKLMAELRVSHARELSDRKEPFDNKANYAKIMRFANEEIKAIVAEQNEQIIIRNKNMHAEAIYCKALADIKSAKTGNEFDEIYAKLNEIRDYKDVITLQDTCLKRAKQAKEEAEQEAIAAKRKKTRLAIILTIVGIVVIVVFFAIMDASQKEDTYQRAITLANEDKYEAAIDEFAKLGDYKDCVQKLEEVQEEAYNTVFVLLEKGEFEAAWELSFVIRDYKDGDDLYKTIEKEYMAYTQMINATIIDNATIEEAKKIVAEHQYVKDAHFVQLVNLYDILGDGQWEYVSGDVNVLSSNIDCHTIKTNLWREKGWLYQQLYIYYGDKKLYLDGKRQQYVDGRDLGYIYEQDMYVGVDYTAKLTEEGNLLITAERDGIITECLYKAVH